MNVPWNALSSCTNLCIICIQKWTDEIFTSKVSFHLKFHFHWWQNHLTFHKKKNNKLLKAKPPMEIIIGNNYNNNNGNSNGNNYCFFLNSHKTCKSTQILAGLFFFFHSGKKKAKTIYPKSEFKKCHENEEKKKYVEFCLSVSPALWYINQPERFED